MNEILRHAMLNAHLDEIDVAGRLEVDPKTVRRWLEGRLPYSRYRWALADLLNMTESDLWPELRRNPIAPDEVNTVYQCRSIISRETWRSLLVSAEHEIDVLSNSGLVLIEQADAERIFSEKSHDGVRIRIVLSDPVNWRIKGSEIRGGADSAMAAEICNTLAVYSRLERAGHIELRLHRGKMYNSIYRADSRMLCELQAYGVSADRCPVLYLQQQNSGSIADMYMSSFAKIWDAAQVIN